MQLLRVAGLQFSDAPLQNAVLLNQPVHRSHLPGDIGRPALQRLVHALQRVRVPVVAAQLRLINQRLQ